MYERSHFKYLLLLPAALWVLCFTIFPLLYGVGLSFFARRQGTYDFHGLGHYADLLSDPAAQQSGVVTLTFVVCGVTVQMVLGLALALLFHRTMPLRGLLRTLITSPLFVTPAAAGYLFLMIFYEGNGGLLNGILPVNIPWLSHPRWALASVILVDVWQWTPFCFLIFLAGLQGIPDDYYEAASIETKNPWAVFRHITLPVLQPTIVLVLLLRITEAFKVFDIPYTLTNGGPGTGATRVLSMYAYQQGMQFRRPGYGAAVCVVLFILVMIVLTVLFKRIRQVHS